MRPRARRRVLRRALRARLRTRGTSRRARTRRRSTTRRSPRWRAGASRPASRSGARSACSRERLAEHCDDLLAIDVAETALDRARERVPRGAASSAARSPRSTRPGTFDLIVCSEVLYYLDAPGVRRHAGPDHAARCSPCTGARRPSATRSPATRSTNGSRSGSARRPTRGGPTSTRSTGSIDAARDRRRRAGRRWPRRAATARPAATATSRSSRPSWPSPTSARRCRRTSCAARLDDDELPIERRGLVREPRRRGAARRRGRDAGPATRTIVLGTGETLHYDACVLATGAEPAVLPVPGATEEWVLLLRSLATRARAARPGGRAAETAVVIGSGLHRLRGGRLAGHARPEGDAGQRRGDPARSPARRRGRARGSRAGWKTLGVELVLGAGVEAIGEHGVHVPGREPLAADLILMAAGVEPARRARGDGRARRPRRPDRRRRADAHQRRRRVRGGRRRARPQRRRRPPPRRRALGRGAQHGRDRRPRDRRRGRAVGRRARLLVDDRRAHAQVRRRGATASTRPAWSTTAAARSRSGTGARARPSACSRTTATRTTRPAARTRSRRERRCREPARVRRRPRARRGGADRRVHRRARRRRTASAATSTRSCSCSTAAPTRRRQRARAAAGDADACA